MAGSSPAMTVCFGGTSLFIVPRLGGVDGPMFRHRCATVFIRVHPCPVNGIGRSSEKTAKTVFSVLMSFPGEGDAAGPVSVHPKRLNEQCSKYSLILNSVQYIF
jgi:hypothetical protein